MTKMEIPAIPRSQSVFGFLVYWVTIVAAIVCILGPMVAFLDLDANIVNPHYEMSNIFEGMKPNFDAQDLQDDAMVGTKLVVVEDVSKFADPEDVDRDIGIRIISGDGVGELATIAAIDTDTDTLELSEPLLNSYTAEQAEIGEVTVWDAMGNNILASDAPAGTALLTLESLGSIEDPTADRPIALMVQDDNNREQVMIDSIDRDNNTIHLKSALVNSYSTAAKASVTQVTAPEEVEGHFWIDNLTNGDGLTQLGLVLGCAVGIPAMGGAALILAFKEKSFGWMLGALAIALLIIVPALGLV